MKKMHFLALCVAIPCLLTTPAWSAQIHNVIVQNGIYTYPESNTELGDTCRFVRERTCNGHEDTTSNSPWHRYDSALCDLKNKRNCICDANVSYPAVKDSDGASAVTKAFKAIAKEYTCSANTAMTELKYEVTDTRPDFLSVVFHGYSLDTAAGGSCHSSVMPRTVNLRTGHIYTLGEILDKSQTEAIARTVENETNALLKDAGQAVFTDTFWNANFYIKDKNLIFDWNNYLLGCADGPSWPIVIPRKFVADPEIKALLN